MFQKVWTQQHALQHVKPGYQALDVISTVRFGMEKSRELEQYVWNLVIAHAARDNGVTRVFKYVDGSISPLEGMWIGLSRALELLVKRVARYADCCLLHLNCQHVGSTCPQHLYVKYKHGLAYHHPGRPAMRVRRNRTMSGTAVWDSSRSRAAAKRYSNA